MTTNVDTIKSAAAGRWLEILQSVGGIDRQLLDGKHHSCPRCGGVDRFRFIDEDAGAILCNQCFNEKNGDGFAAVGWATGKPFPEVMKLIGDYLGMPATNGSNGHKTNGASEKERTLASQFFQVTVADSIIERWLDTKRPITREAIEAAGCLTVSWPKGAPHGCGFSCLAVPFRNSKGTLKAVSLYRLDGEDFPMFGSLTQRKIHTLRG